MFHGQTNEAPVPASIKVDVSDVARTVASTGRLLRARFDLHSCWMENGGLKTTISKDSPTSEAPLCSHDVEVSPPPGEFSKGKTAVGARVAPIAVEDEPRQQRGFGRSRARHGSEWSKRHRHGSRSLGRVADRLARRQTSQR